VLFYLTFSEKIRLFSKKNHRIILINYRIIHIWRCFAYHILYHIRVLSSESDILIRRIPINRIWILKNGFGDGFGTEIILSVYIPKSLTRIHEFLKNSFESSKFFKKKPFESIQRSHAPCMHRSWMKIPRIHESSTGHKTKGGTCTICWTRRRCRPYKDEYWKT
jgi:hypothetical protein